MNNRIRRYIQLSGQALGPDPDSSPCIIFINRSQCGACKSILDGFNTSSGFIVLASCN